MWFLLVSAVLAAIVGYDAAKRNANAFGWGIGTFLLAVIFMPLYYAKRPLLAGEVREGGTGWNFLRNFALMWTGTMILAGLAAIAGMGSIMGSASTEAEAAGAAIGGMIGFGILGAFWFFPVLGALVLGLLLRKSTVVERGPQAA